MANYIDRPGLDQAEIISDGRVYPVVMSIPIGGSSSEGGEITSGSALGFNIPEYDTLITTEDANGELVRVQYKKSGATVKTLNFTYSDVVFTAPYRTTTVEAV
jgi:hypothetical protein